MEISEEIILGIPARAILQDHLGYALNWLKWAKIGDYYRGY